VRALAALLWFPLVLLATGCDYSASQKPAFQGVDITGAGYGEGFALTDHNGKLRRIEDFRGKAVLIFFGFTHCPDVCPSALHDMAQALKLLGADAARVQVLFVTLDPERDAQEVLAKYVPSFDATFLGLRGDAEATRKAAKSFHVFYEKRPGKTPESYTIDHFSGTFAFDPQGRVRLLFDYGTAAEKIAHDLKLLLS
jgi:protein SCO1